jgi:hypothetical protein
MFIVPRTPASPRRLTPISMVSSSSTSPKTQSASPTSFKAEKDIYDTFLDIYFSSELKVQSVLIQKITDYVGHPVYTHLLRTMDKDNAHHVIGYLKSQRSVELYFILDQIINNPLPTKNDFYSTLINK